jgi:anti-sigma regulatory factor (Ser/Thr protein kinase)
MVDATHKSFKADDRSYFSILKKEIHLTVLNGGYSKKKLGEFDLIISELTSNLTKHAIGGEILFAHIKNDYHDYLEVISIDNGPGMADANKMIADGISTTNTLGHGFGSIKRLSDKFEVYSQKGWGTIVLSRIYKNQKVTKNDFPVDISALVVAKPGESVSGDAFHYRLTPNYLKLLVADGLGHGIEANKAVNEAVTAFDGCSQNDPIEIVKYIHSAIKKTRGMVGTVLVFDLKKRVWQTVGVGNISMKLTTGSGYKNHLSYNGIIGHNIPTSMKVQEFNVSEFNQLILCSDGITSRWETTKFPKINRCDLSIQAAIVYKEFARKTDDMTVIITKCG